MTLGRASNLLGEVVKIVDDHARALAELEEDESKTLCRRCDTEPYDHEVAVLTSSLTLYKCRGRVDMYYTLRTNE